MEAAHLGIVMLISILISILFNMYERAAGAAGDQCCRALWEISCITNYDPLPQNLSIKPERREREGERWRESDREREREGEERDGWIEREGQKETWKHTDR